MGFGLRLGSSACSRTQQVIVRFRPFPCFPSCAPFAAAGCSEGWTLRYVLSWKHWDHDLSLSGVGIGGLLHCSSAKSQCVTRVPNARLMSITYHTTIAWEKPLSSDRDAGTCRNQMRRQSAKHCRCLRWCWAAAWFTHTPHHVFTVH